MGLPSWNTLRRAKWRLASGKAVKAASTKRPSTHRIRFCASADESRALNGVEGPCLIMAGSGMCTGGRIHTHAVRERPSVPDTSVRNTCSAPS